MSGYGNIHFDHITFLIKLEPSYMRVEMMMLMRGKSAKRDILKRKVLNTTRSSINYGE